MEANQPRHQSADAVRDSGILKKSPAPIPDAFKWVNDLSLRRGTWAVCYTYVLGRRDEEWQQSPLVTPGGDVEQDSSYGPNVGL